MNANKVRQCWCVQKQLWSKTRSIQARHYQWKTGTYGHPARKQPNQSEIRHQGILSEELYQFLCAYRLHGHKMAKINPVALTDVRTVPELDVRRFVDDVNKISSCSNFLNGESFSGTISEAEKLLVETYADKVGVEFMHLEEEQERIWFQERWEELVTERVPPDVQREIAKELIRSQVLDKFMAIKFVSFKRYSAEGGETQLTFFQELLRLSLDNGIKELVVAGHHRGRLNVSVNLMKLPPELLFRKVIGKSEFPEGCERDGDVTCHLCPSSVLESGGRKMHVEMTNLPSHLEVVCPVSQGKSRALQQVMGDCDYSRDADTQQVLNVQVHGDAAFMGQGVCQESLLMSLSPHFKIGGSIHLIVNNHLGFTAPPEVGRGTRYATDLAKVISAPVIHVNAEYPEEVLKATRIACEYQRKFRKNVFVDLNCYRRWGHNELDDPTITNPLLYKIISSKVTIPDSYASKLIKDGVMEQQEVDALAKEYQTQLSAALESAGSYNPPAPEKPLWSGFSSAPNAITTWDTGVDKDLLKTIGLSSVRVPEGFSVHPNVVKSHVATRIRKMNLEDNIDWATAEALAFGSLIYNGYNVRISGQDVGRGTFSQRHAMLVDQQSDDVYVPLNHISEDQIGHLEVANSLLSEEAVVAFEYGFSTVTPNTLVIWEAQYGDFANNAQVPIDQYVSSGETKWLAMSGLTMLLPHGHDGGGPEHTSCHMERYLQLSDSSETSPDGDDVNMQIVNPSTPAQYFHLLRRQMVRNYRKPLIVVTPKTLLRSPDAVSHLNDLTPGSTFQPVLGDDSTDDPSAVKRLIFTSGKHYYALKKHKTQRQLSNVAIIRLEEFSPFPTHHLRSEIAKYKNAKEFIWSQEEPRNMGGWTFCFPRFYNLVGCKLTYAGRPQAASCAVGIDEIHQKQAQMVIESPFQ